MTLNKPNYTNDLFIKERISAKVPPNKEIKEDKLNKIPIISFKSIIENCKIINDIRKLEREVKKFK